MAIKKIPTSQLKVGMYLHKLGGSWLQHPFMRSSFLIEESNVIKKIYQAGIKEVYIDNEQGNDVEVEYVIEPKLASKPATDDLNQSNNVNTSLQSKNLSKLQQMQQLFVLRSYVNLLKIKLWVCLMTSEWVEQLTERLLKQL
jgi:hypothetical protein